jgi:hypothetical protein
MLVFFCKLKSEIPKVTVEKEEEEETWTKRGSR